MRFTIKEKSVGTGGKFKLPEKKIEVKAPDVKVVNEVPVPDVKVVNEVPAPDVNVVNEVNVETQKSWVFEIQRDKFGLIKTVTATVNEG